MLLKRKNIYYFRWQVPKDLRPYLGYELTRSLRTCDREQAFISLTQYTQLVLMIKETRRMLLLKELSQENYEETILSIKKKFDERSIYLSHGKRVKLSPNQILKSNKSYRDVLIAELNGLDYTPTFKPVTVYMLPTLADVSGPSDKLSYRFTLKRVKEELSKKGVLKSMEAQGFYSENEAIIEKFKRDYSNIKISRLDREIDLLEGRTPVVEAYKRPIASQVLEEKPSSVITFSRFIAEEFLQFKKSLSVRLTEKAEKEYITHFTKIMAVIEDKPLDKYSKQDIKKCLEDVSLLPQKNRSPYNKLTYKEILELGELPEKDLISVGTVDHIRKTLQGVFATAIEMEFITESPARNLGWKTPESSFGNYTGKEINTLYEESQKEQGWKKWLVSIGILSGCRLSEIIHLRVEDIVRDEDTGIYYFNITDEAGSVKTKAAIRKVPVHSLLIQGGLLNYRDDIGKGRLFNVKDKWATNWFSQFREQCGIEHRNEKNQRRVFHSFRHWVVTQSRAKIGNDALIQQVVGHEKTNAGVTDRYTDEMPLHDLQRVIECLSVVRDVCV